MLEQTGEGLRIAITDGVVHITPDPAVPFVELKPRLYAAINELGRTAPVRVHGVPACLLPDAVELLDRAGEDCVRVPACAACELRRTCPGVPKARAERQGTEAAIPFTNQPRELTLEVNRACMFACPFCFYKNFYEHDDRNVPSKELLCGLMDQAKALGVRTIRFFGGDPILRKDFIGLLDEARARGLHAIVNTNGIFRSREHMREVFSRAGMVVVSLHGWDAASEQELTGRGDLLKRLLLWLGRAAAEFPGKLMLSTLITTHLLGNFGRYAALIRRLGVRQWGLNRPMFTPDGPKQYPWLRFGPDEVVALARSCLALKREAGIDVRLNNYPWCLFPDGLHEVLAPNIMYNGVSRLFYDVSGYFKPVASMNLDLGRDLGQAWKRNPFKQVGMRTFVPPACRDCEHFSRCAGGSRSQAHAWTGDWFGRDPLMVR
jgi:MoaA/NifB/PqqE/SkfB family radical SAM enzyme